MPRALILMGSKNDLPVAEKALLIFKKFDVSVELMVASAHRTPKRVEELVSKSDAEVFIAIAGLSAALPGVVASLTVKPVIGVPVSGDVNLDAILSVIQMPPGIPVAAVGLDRGDNAALLAIQMMSIRDNELVRKMIDYRSEMADKVLSDSKQVIINV